MLSGGPEAGKILSLRAQSGWLSRRAMIPRPALLILSTWMSGSVHWYSFFLTFSMLRHSKRCFTQVKPASLASLRSRSASSRWPQRKTWTAAEAGSTLPPSRTRLTVGLATLGNGVGDAAAGLAVAPGFASAPGFGVAAGGGLDVHPATTV